jgi:phosphoribosylformylglycinamidine synthase
VAKNREGMVTFFLADAGRLIAIQHPDSLSGSGLDRLVWLLGGARVVDGNTVSGLFRGPRREMVTPWSTNAVEITRNMGLEGIDRMEQFFAIDAQGTHDPMLEMVYTDPGQDLFHIEHTPEAIRSVDDIAAYNAGEGLALSDEEIGYLEDLSCRLGRKLTDSEVFGFSQVNSEHCRHKIFNGTFIIDGEEKPFSLFSLIRRTTSEHRNRVVSAYKDNVAFISGPEVVQFAPAEADRPSFFSIRSRPSVISLKAETHNFPTTVEPFNGAATGTGGEIRDRMAGGKGSLPIAGTAVYITSYPRLLPDRQWEAEIAPRPWLYQTPADILIKASNGASDFGNKFGQPLICGSLLTFEHETADRLYGYDKVIMLAGGVGYGYAGDAGKDTPSKGDVIVVMGGDNYRIGMGGGAVSSVATGEFSNSIELNAVQRSNPEMQKRVCNAVRAMVEADHNPIVSIHDHGAGGHLNSLSELVEETGGVIDINRLPVGDPTLSAREIIGNESQERMGLVIRSADLELLQRAADRERAPMYAVGHVTGDQHLCFTDTRKGKHPIDLDISDFFGKPPRTVMEDRTVAVEFPGVETGGDMFDDQLLRVLQLESVACKDWLTNKVDRSVTGKVAMQQCTGAIQLPLNNLAVVALDYSGRSGIATALGHAPAAALIDPCAGSRLSVTEALSNIMWAPLTHGLSGVSLSANWMWPCKNEGEDARLYAAVEALSDFCVGLGINVPTGKDSLSMTQKYPDGSKVICPGTVIVTAVAEVSDITRCVTPDLKPQTGSELIFFSFAGEGYPLGGSAYAQVYNQLGNDTPDVTAGGVVRCFNLVQHMIAEEMIIAGHDVSAGGVMTTLLEMIFPTLSMGFDAYFPAKSHDELTRMAFSEQPGVVIQAINGGGVLALAAEYGVPARILGRVTQDGIVNIISKLKEINLDPTILRDEWYRTSYLLDRRQSGIRHATERYNNYSMQPLEYIIPERFSGTFASYGIDPLRDAPTGIRGGIIREKGVNGDREMAWSMYLAGFDVRDIHMTDLIEGRETLDDLHFLVFVGGFSNSDVLGSAKGWAGAFLYNPKARESLDRFYSRHDTLSLGVCNGCQLMVELGLIGTGEAQKPQMLHNDSGKFESAFLTIDISPNNSVMLRTLAGSRLGIWVAHGEGKFSLPGDAGQYHIPAKYSYTGYPGNPNGSDHDAAAIASHDGRHLAIMPHLERSVYPWNWAYYPNGRRDEVSPWIEAFVNAREWVTQQLSANKK